MRKLQTCDLFATLRLIKRAELKEQVKPLLKMASDGQFSTQEVGIEGILCLLEAVTDKKTETAIYEVLAGPFEMDAVSVGSMPLDALAESLQTLLNDNDLKRFFTLLAALISK